MAVLPRSPHYLSFRCCKTEEALKEAIMYEWEQISYEEINRLIFSMPDHMQECSDHDGMNTKYQKSCIIVK